MIRFLTLEQIYRLQERVLAQQGGIPGTRDPGAVEAALAQPTMTFAGQDFYPTIPEKAAALCFSLVKNHAFLDGNKRVGHAAMETFLLMNGLELDASVDEQERVILSLAAGELERDEFTEWVKAHVRPWQD